MHGGRKSPLARALRDEARADLIAAPRLTRRELLKAGGVLGAGAALAACTHDAQRPSAARPAAVTPHDARVVVVGAGLAGVTVAYRLARAGIRVDLYEARDRLGGRCWTAHGFVDGQTAEHGGEFIDSRHVHIRGLARELGLTLEDLWSGYATGASYPRWVDGSLLPRDETKPQMARITAAAMREARRIGVIDAQGRTSARAISYGTATPAAQALDQLSMTEWLSRNVEGIVGTRVGEWLDEVMAGWYGLNMDHLSSLNWMDYAVIPAPGADERWHVRGGNDQIIVRAVKALPDDAVHVGSPLVAIRRSSQGTYELTFDGTVPATADILVLTLPFTTLRLVDLSGAGFGPQTMAAIADLAMGDDVKLLLQYDRRPGTFGGWSGGMEYADPDFDTWESSVVQPGSAGLITVYAGGRTGAGWSAPDPHGPAPHGLVKDILGRIDDAVPGTAARFNGRAWADLWTRDPWTQGAYAAFAVGQHTRFWGGTGAPDGNAHFAGEATSTYSQGYLNGGVESGDRVATEVMRKLGVPIPAWLAALPH